MFDTNKNQLLSPILELSDIKLCYYGVTRGLAKSLKALMLITKKGL